MTDEMLMVIALPMGSLASLQRLNLQRNQIGDEGMKAFTSALSCGALPSLVHLDLRSNSIGNEGMIAFVDAIKRAY